MTGRQAETVKSHTRSFSDRLHEIVRRFHCCNKAWMNRSACNDVPGLRFAAAAASPLVRSRAQGVSRMIRSTIPVRRVFALGIFGVATFAAAAPLLAQTAGYAARPSGFDLNFNGVVGEAGTADQNVCNGIGNETSTTGKDIDGNGVADRQVYVDLTGGSDNTA